MFRSCVVLLNTLLIVAYFFELWRWSLLKCLHNGLRHKLLRNLPSQGYTLAIEL